MCQTFGFHMSQKMTEPSNTPLNNTKKTLEVEDPKWEYMEYINIPNLFTKVECVQIIPVAYRKTYQY